MRKSLDFVVSRSKQQHGYEHPTISHRIRDPGERFKTLHSTIDQLESDRIGNAPRRLQPLGKGPQSSTSPKKSSLGGPSTYFPFLATNLLTDGDLHKLKDLRPAQTTLVSVARRKHKEVHPCTSIDIERRHKIMEKKTEIMQDLDDPLLTAMLGRLVNVKVKMNMGSALRDIINKN